MIQDFIISGGEWVLLASLLPTLFSRHRPSKTTSCMYGSVLLTMAVCMLTLDLYAAAVGTGANALVWYLILLTTKSTLVT